MKYFAIPLSLNLVLSLGLCTSQLSSQTPPESSPPPEVTYKKHDLADAVVHLITIPKHNRYSIRPEVADGLMTVDDFGQQERPGDSSAKTIAVINGGYFDPKNQQTTSYIRVGGKIKADPQQNARLVENPDLQVYLPKILNRSEFRQYQCGTTVEYAITTYQQSIPDGCELNYSLGAGPQLLPQLTSPAEGFTDSVNGQVTRDAIGSHQPNARSAIGITEEGNVVWVMVEQQSSNKPGLSLAALANFLQQQGVKTALNLDGGTSSSLVYREQVLTGKKTNGQPLLRPVKSVLILQENAPN